MTAAFVSGNPGGWDALHVEKLACLREPVWGIPMLEPAYSVPESLVCWTQATGEERVPGVHFFTDDYRFERVWNAPERYLDRLRRADVVLSPDFSCWRDWPRAANLWNVYRSRWLAAYWQAHGLAVVPTVTWAGPESWAWAFLGIPEGSVVAISTIGVSGNDEQTRRHFADGYAEMCLRLMPDTVLVYGLADLPAALMELAPVRRYSASRIDDMVARIEAGAERPGQAVLWR